MKNYNLIEDSQRIENANKTIKIECNSLEDVKIFLIKNGLKFIRYSDFSNNIYYTK